MPRIVAAAGSLPPHIVDQKSLKALAGRIFPGMEKQLRVFDNSRIESRQFVKPVDWYLKKPSPSERNRAYLQEGLDLLKDATAGCLERAGLLPSDIDHLVCVSSTGHATPSLDARLINEMGFSPATTRLPVWGLGCAAGAAGLARAFDHCRAYPGSRVLLCALECCSLTFVQEDASVKNLVGTALFADGAAAVVVAGDEVGGSGPRILARASHLFPDTYRIMGWDFGESGMELVLSPRLPALIRQKLQPLVAAFLEGEGLSQEEIHHYVTHPGGARIIDAYRQALGLGNGELALSEESLRRHGNISSVSVLMVLEAWLASQPEKKPGHSLLSAFGPGFSAEMLLLEA